MPEEESIARYSPTPYIPVEYLAALTTAQMMIRWHGGWLEDCLPEPTKNWCIGWHALGRWSRAFGPESTGVLEALLNRGVQVAKAIFNNGDEDAAWDVAADALGACPRM